MESFTTENRHWLQPWRRTIASLLLITGLSLSIKAEDAKPGLNAGGSGNPYARWGNGLSPNTNYFPIAVWLQDIRNAPKYKAVGINLYIGLWRGPTEEQLTALKQAGMPLICHQSELALKSPNRDIIAGWMHGDEPDNAQSLGNGKGYGDPIIPAKIIADYERIRAADPTRPIMLNLGQGVAWDGWHGRGRRTNHPEDYADYIKGCDIASFDIYPAVHDKPQVAGKLWLVPFGVDRLRQWSRDGKVVWNCIECTHIGNREVKPTPRQVKAEVWMSLIHGSMGLIYFVHQFQPKFIEAGLLADQPMLEAVTAINHQIQSLAPVLNSPSLTEEVLAMSANEAVPVDVMTKRLGKERYVFAVAMRDGVTKVSFEVKGNPTPVKVEVLEEKRTLELKNGRFQDEFRDFEAHIYRIE